ncbi:hypothetical protein DPMN_160709 [Dreissena polymorpha]|uniref:Uncharacterized protein n=1 Tax=Dreissena polymorpha TaxID=45954 RepID=A0A9D4ENN0_DREPO|nr:hypothetical protein DPMN_160709 [Dreissena polymorpha]
MLSDVAASVGLSSRTGHNIPQLVGDTSNPVVIKDRKDYLSTLFHHIKNVTKFHQFPCVSGSSRCCGVQGI